MKLMKRKKKNKIKANHEVISSILNTPFAAGNKMEVIRDNFYGFVMEHDNIESFSIIFNVLMNNEFVRRTLNYYELKLETHTTNPQFRPSQISNEKLAVIYALLLVKNSDVLLDFEIKKRLVTKLIINGDYESAVSEIISFQNEYGESLWMTSVLLFSLSHCNSNSARKIFHELVNRISLLPDLIPKQYLQTALSRYHAHNMRTFIDNDILRFNREFTDANAHSLSGLNALLQLPYPLYEQADSIYSVWDFQSFNIIDLYHFVSECIIQLNINEQCNSRVFPSQEKEVLMVSFRFLEKELNDKTKLKDYRIKHNHIDEYTESVIELYTKGHYDEIITSLEENVLTIGNAISNICIYAKSYIHAGRSPASHMPYVLKEAIESLISIYSLKHVNNSIQKLVELATRIHPLDINKHILLSVVKTAPYYFNEEETQKIVVQANYLHECATPIERDTLLFAPPHLYSLPYKKLESSTLILLKYELIELINKGNFVEAEERLVEYKEINPVYKDFIDLKTYFLIRSGDKKSLLDFAARTLIETPQSYICFPLPEIISYINNEHLYTVEAVIATYIYNINSKLKNQEYFNDVFEEFIIESGVERPSELLGKEISEMHYFFLKEIATIENMDYLGCFDDEIDLTLERTKIISALKERGYIDKIEFSSEFSELIDNVIVDSGVAKLSTAKVFVDTDNILRKNKSEIDSLISLIEHGDDVSAFNNLIEFIVSAYINDPDSGLDRNLSSEIRHGFFNNIMCSKLKEYNLLCEVSDSGGIENNVYWMNYYKMVNNNILKDINKVFERFTVDFLKTIEIAEVWMKTDTQDNPERMFCFSIDVIDHIFIRGSVHVNGLSSMPVCIMQLLNKKLIHNIEKIQSKLSKDLTVEIDKIFTTIMNSINLSKRTTSLTDLNTSIATAHYETKECIMTVCEWFNLKGDVEFEPCPIENVIKLAKKCFEKISPTHIEFDITSSNEFICSNVQGEHISSLVQTLINCFNNAIKYGTSKNNINIKIDNICKESYKISVFNTVPQYKIDELNSGALSELKVKLSKMKSDELLAKEGGSGLYKSKYDLQRCSKQFELSVDLCDGVFTVDVSYHAENTNS